MIRLPARPLFAQDQDSIYRNRSPHPCRDKISETGYSIMQSSFQHNKRTQRLQFHFLHRDGSLLYRRVKSLLHLVFIYHRAGSLFIVEIAHSFIFHRAGSIAGIDRFSTPEVDHRSRRRVSSSWTIHLSSMRSTNEYPSF